MSPPPDRRAEIEVELEEALQSGRFIGYNSSFDFVQRLEEINTRLEAISHYSAEPAADLLAASHPAVAARVYRALGLRVVNAGRSKYYDAALAHLERARDCYLSAGRADLWEDVVADLRRRHARKTSFMPGFERVAAGGPAREREPSILERAKSRWPKLRDQ